MLWLLNPIVHRRKHKRQPMNKILTKLNSVRIHTNQPSNYHKLSQTTYPTTYVFHFKRNKMSWWSSRDQISAQRSAIVRFGHDRFLPDTFQFIIHYHLLLRRHIVWAIEKPSLNKLQINKNVPKYVLYPILACQSVVLVRKITIRRSYKNESIQPVKVTWEGGRRHDMSLGLVLRSM